MTDELYHHGIKGQRWGIRRYQNPDGTLTPKGRARLEKKMNKKDMKWVNRNSDKIYKATYKRSKKEMDEFVKEGLNRKYAEQIRQRKVGLSYVNDYNRALATLMNTHVGQIEAPSGKIVQFVAKRGSMGVYMALADKGYDMSNVKNGVYGSGRIAYRKTVVNKQG